MRRPGQPCPRGLPLVLGLLFGLLAGCTGAGQSTDGARSSSSRSSSETAAQSAVQLGLAFDATRMSEADWLAAATNVEAVADRFEAGDHTIAGVRSRYLNWTLSDPSRRSRLGAFIDRESDGWQPFSETLPWMAMRIEMDLPSGRLALWSSGPPCDDRGRWFYASRKDLDHGKTISAESCRELMSILGLSD